MPDNLPPHRFRVPREDRSLLSIPDLETASDLVEENRKLFASSECSLHGRSLADLRSAARRSAIAAAHSYTSQLLRTSLPQVSDNSCVVSGHQPELFHVGVWAKNFTLAGVARRIHSVPLNLVIDNDTLNSTSIRVPEGTREHLRIDCVPFDTARSPLPWEEARVLDRDLFERFGTDISNRIRDTWGFDPLLETEWSAAVQSPSGSERLCDGLTGLRARIERKWGLSNLELPMSRLCETEPFLWFFAHLIMRLPELHGIYNEAVAEYRREHRLRNRMQPVPDLESSEGWLEAPFWVWQRGDTDRGRLFARRVGSACELRYQGNTFTSLPYSLEGSLEAAVKQLSELPARGLRLRTRALTTTLFARSCLADLFVHGIGGAKYDAMTDRICERLFGLKAPSFLTVSATLYLPLGGAFNTTETQLRDVNRGLRDLKYNPDRYLNDVADADAMISEKNGLLVNAQELRTSNRLRGRLTPQQHRRITEIRLALQSHTESIRRDLESARSKVRLQLAANGLVRNREYSFALYPEDQLRQFLTPLSAGKSLTEE